MVSAGNRRGVIAMAGAMALYVLNDAFVKLVAATHPVGQILAVRGVFATALVLAIAFAAGAFVAWRAALRPIVGVRAALEIVAAATSVAALALLPIANVTAIMLAAPLIITVAVMMLRMEAVRPRRIALAAVGFGGVLLVLRPEARGLEIGGAFAILLALALAGRDLVTRRMPKEIPTGLIAVVTTAAAALAGLAMSSLEGWQSLSARETSFLAAAALFSGLGNYLLIIACRDVDLSVVAPFRYTILLWALIVGFLVWADVPDLPAFAGMALIAAAGVAVLRDDRRERVSTKAVP